jgi:GNAT superfamily N-acetyltransferase
VDLIVHPNYQGRGIGKRILRELRDEMSEFVFTTLTAAYGKHGFYLKQGWKRQASAFIWPRNEEQTGQHTR